MTAPTLLKPSRWATYPSVTAHMAGLSLGFTGAGMAVCAAVDAIEGGSAVVALLAASVLTVALGETIRRRTHVPGDLPPRAVFVAVSVSWLATSVLGALPFLFSGLISSFEPALFESISGFTCTGSTVLSAEDFAAASPGVLFWRQLTQWFGGMGIIVLAVAVLPFLGVGGLDLIRAEAPGPTSDRLAPRVSETAKRLWLVYVGFTVVSTVALLATGLDWFDASGIALALADKAPGLRARPVEPEGFDDVTRSLAAGSIQRNESMGGSICDAIVTPQPGNLTFPIMSALCGPGLTVTDDEALSGVAEAFLRLKIVAEPGGAVALAAALTRKHEIEGDSVVAVVSGGNVDPGMFTRALETLS